MTQLGSSIGHDFAEAFAGWTSRQIGGVWDPFQSIEDFGKQLMRALTPEEAQVIHSATIEAAILAGLAEGR